VATDCSDCDSSNIVERQSVQHDPCGCIRPRAAFVAGDEGELECPQCDATDRQGMYSVVGRFYVCLDCLQRFDATQRADRPTVTSVTEGGRPESRVTRGGYWVAVTVFLSFVVVAALALSVGIVPGETESDSTSPVRAESDPVVQAPNEAAAVVDPGFDRSAPSRGAPPETGLDVPLDSNYSAPDVGSYEAIVVYRNDDVMANTRPGALQNVTEVFAETGVPVTYGVIGKTSPNATVCSYLRALGSRHPRQFDTALHGYTHANFLANNTDGNGASRTEFAGRPYREQQARIQKGTANLTQCTGDRPETFVPPFDTYDKTTARALNATGYDTVSGGAWSYGNDQALFADGGLTHVSYIPTAERVQVYYNYSESPPSPHSVARINRSFDRAYRNNSLFLVTMHYRHFTDERALERLRRIIEHQQSHDAAFMTVGQVAQAVRQGRLARTDDGWRLSDRPGKPANGTAVREVGG